MENIEDIISKINSAPASEQEEKKSSGLVFEFVKLDEDEVAAEKIEYSADSTDEVSFSLPDSFEATEKYDVSAVSPLDGEGASRIWTTYVPRFTEASENYRMASEPRPARIPLRERVRSAEPQREPITEEVKIDPTAEIDSAVAEAVVVEMDSSARDEAEESINVYKFRSEEVKETAPPERTVSDERAEIDRLLAKEEPKHTLDETTTEDSSASEEPKVYDIPDPISEQSPRTAEKTEKENTPAGLDDSPVMADKKILTEFTHPTQRDRFKDSFLDKLMSVKIRLGAAILFSLILLVFEAFYFFGALKDKLFSLPITPAIPALIDFLFVIAAFLLALPEVVRGFSLCARKKPVPELMLPLCFLSTLAYYAVLLSSKPVESYPLFGFIFSVLPIAVILASLCRTVADFVAFKAISVAGEKQILDKKMTRDLPEENMALDGIIDEYKSQSALFYKTSFITDFFARTKETPEKPERTAVLLSVPLGVALVAGSVAFFLMGGIVSAMAVLSFVMLLASPAFAILSYKVAYSDSQKAAVEEESAGVGEIAFSDFSGVDVIAFDDTEIFGPDDVNLKRFMLYGDSDGMERAMHQMCALFSVAGGPLNYIFEGALDNKVRRVPAENPEIEEDGLAGDVFGSRVCAGSEAYMKRHGIAIPDYSPSSDSGIDTTKVMYAAENGEIFAKFYVRYSFSEEFTMLLPELKEQGIVPLVYTRDPNISNELLRTLTAGADCMRVMKKLVPKVPEEKVYSRVRADIVTFGEKTNAISTVVVARKYRRLLERVGTTELYAMIAGGILAVLLSLFGMIAVSGVIFGFWQIGWCAVLYFSSRRALLADKLLEKKIAKEENK